MQSFGRPRQYVSAARLYAMFPLLRFSHERGAYVLRFVGESRGPVLRKDRRRRQHEFTGPDRREGGVDLLAARPIGGVRRIEVSKAVQGTAKAAPPTQKGSHASAATPRGADASPATSRRRQHGRQRPPRPHR